MGFQSFLCSLFKVAIMAIKGLLLTVLVVLCISDAFLLNARVPFVVSYNDITQNTPFSMAFDDIKLDAYKVLGISPYCADS